MKKKEKVKKKKKNNHNDNNKPKKNQKEKEKRKKKKKKKKKKTVTNRHLQGDGELVDGRGLDGAEDVDEVEPALCVVVETVGVRQPIANRPGRQLHAGHRPNQQRRVVRTCQSQLDALKMVLENVDVV